MTPALSITLACLAQAGGLVHPPVPIVRLAPPPGGVGSFGRSVAIDGDTLVVGASVGAAYVFDRNAGGPNAWGMVQELLPPVPTPNYGRTVAVSGTTLAVATPVGSVFVYEQSVGAWNLQQLLVRGDQFGKSVDVEGDTLIGGAPGAASGKFNTPFGWVGIFERDAGGPGAWGEVDVVGPNSAGCDGYGFMVDLDRNRLVSAAPVIQYFCGSFSFPGQAYVHDREGGVWSSGVPLPHPPEAKLFGAPVALSGERVAVVGALGPAWQRTILVYELQPGGWVLVAEVQGGQFQLGESLELSSELLIAGDPGQNNTNQPGDATIFVRDLGGPNAYGELIRLRAHVPTPADRYGYSVALDGKTLAIGAPSAGFKGVVFLYEFLQPAPKATQPR